MIRFSERYVFSMLLLFPLQGSATNSVNCHLHPPADVTQLKQPQILSSDFTSDNCRQQNIQRFAGQGWCHCSFSGLMGLTSETPGNPFKQRFNNRSESVLQ